MALSDLIRPKALNTKKCTRCLKEKALVLFPKSPRKDGHTALCQLCTHARDTNKREKYLTNDYGTLRVRRAAYNMWCAARTRAWRKNLEFSLTEGWIYQKLLKGTCEVTGIEFADWTGARTNFRPSIDRINTNLGYTADNCRVVVWIYNAAKNTGTDDDVLRMAKALIARADAA